MTTNEIQERLNELHTSVLNAKNRLAETDYIAAKIAEGKATKQEYKDEIDARQALRDEINAAEDEIKRIEAIEPEEPEVPHDVE